MCLFGFNIDSRSGTSWDTCLRLQTYCADGTVRIHAKMAPRKGPRKEALKTCPAEATFRDAEGPWKGSAEGNKFPLKTPSNTNHGSTDGHGATLPEAAPTARPKSSRLASEAGANAPRSKARTRQVEVSKGVRNKGGGVLSRLWRLEDI